MLVVRINLKSRVRAQCCAFYGTPSPLCLSKQIPMTLSFSSAESSFCTRKIGTPLLRYTSEFTIFSIMRFHRLTTIGASPVTSKSVPKLQLPSKIYSLFGLYNKRTGLGYDCRQLIAIYFDEQMVDAVKIRIVEKLT